MKRKLLQIQLYFLWARIMRLREKGTRRIAQGASFRDQKLQMWSYRITALGLELARLQRRYLTRYVDKSCL